MSAAPGPSSVLVYTIDGRDRIDSIEGDWDAFALDNGAPDLIRDQVLGNSIWQFIEGLEAAEIHRLLFTGVRSRGVEITLPFRCDAPRLRRDMEMVIRRQGKDGIEIRSSVVREQKRAYIGLRDASARRSNQIVRVCSWCKKVQYAPHGWVEVEHAVRGMRLLAVPPVPQISHGMCEPCLEGFRAQLEHDQRQCG